VNAWSGLALGSTNLRFGLLGHCNSWIVVLRAATAAGSLASSGSPCGSSVPYSVPYSRYGRISTRKLQPWTVLVAPLLDSAAEPGNLPKALL
jgi:hypothetical protein